MNQSDQIVWEELPQPVRQQPGKRATSVWLRRLEPVMSRPGRWARVCEVDNRDGLSAASHLRRAAQGLGRYRVPAGRWEFAARTVSNGDGKHYYIYACYLGTEEES